MTDQLDKVFDLIRDQFDVKDLLIEQQQKEIEALEAAVEELQNDLSDANEALDLCETEIAAATK